MKRLNDLIKILSLLLVMAITLISCKDSLPTGIDSFDKYTVLTSIRLMNAGPNGDIVLEGSIDQEKKEVSFPKIDPTTDFSNLRFEAVMSDGAKLEKEVYSFTFGEGDTERSMVFKVVNSPRTGEYLSKIVLKLPPVGVDLVAPDIYDFTSNAMGNPLYPDFSGATTRGAAFNGEYVLVNSRFGGTNPHLLRVSDLKVGIIAKLPLITTGIQGGSVALTSGALVGSSIMLNNSSGVLGTSPLKLYYYQNITSIPEVISFNGDGYTVGNGSSASLGTFPRTGDMMSYNLDENGYGAVYSINNASSASPNGILKLTIEGFNRVVNAKVIPRPVATSANTMTMNASYNRVERTSDYILTSYDAPLYVVDSDGAVSYDDKGLVFPKNMSDVRVFTFNKSRYLLTITVPRASGGTNTILQLYDITPGSNTVEALERFAKKELVDRRPVFEHNYNYSGNGSGAQLAQTAYHIIKDGNGEDSKLQIFGANNDAGFAIVEFSKNMRYED